MQAGNESGMEAAIEAMTRGAVEVLAKPGPNEVGHMAARLPNKIRAAAHARVRTLPRAAAKPVRPAGIQFAPDSLIAIGASTGGIVAIEQILTELPPGAPPVVIVQHIPPYFSTTFAARLDALCANSNSLVVKEAADGDPIVAGQVLVAPGDRHMLVRRDRGSLHVSVCNGPVVQHQRPSVDLLFSSIAQAAVARSIAVLLTGMGTDGAQGLLELRNSGAHTIAQDEATCTVFGMPKAAIALDAPKEVLPLHSIAGAILHAAAV